MERMAKMVEEVMAREVTRRVEGWRVLRRLEEVEDCVKGSGRELKSEAGSKRGKGRSA